jgi:hypothetical protein
MKASLEEANQKIQATQAQILQQQEVNKQLQNEMSSIKTKW